MIILLHIYTVEDFNPSLRIYILRGQWPIKILHLFSFPMSKMYSPLSLKTPPTVGVSNEKWCNTATKGRIEIFNGLNEKRSNDDDELIFFGYSLIFCFCGFVLIGVFRQWAVTSMDTLYSVLFVQCYLKNHITAAYGGL